MARRVFIGAGTVRMSYPGYDAASAPDANLLFNSDGPPYNGLYQSGILGSGAFSEYSQGVSQGTKYIRTGRVAFGKTFPVTPRAFVGAIDPYTGSYTPNPTYDSTGFGSTSGKATGSALTMTFSVDTAGISVTIEYVYYDGSGYVRQLNIPYAVFQV